MATIPMFDPSGQVRAIPSADADSARKAGGIPAVKMLDPKGIQRWIPENQVDAAIKAGGKKVGDIDLTSNTNIDPKTGKGEGTYEFVDNSGKSIQVPYSKVPKAMELGYKTTEKDRVRYAKDSNWEYWKQKMSTPYGKEEREAYLAPTKTPSYLEEFRFHPTIGGASPEDIKAKKIPEAVDGPTPWFWSTIRDSVAKDTEHVKGEKFTNFAKDVGSTLFGIADFAPHTLGAIKDALSDDPDIQKRGIDDLNHLWNPAQMALDVVNTGISDYKEGGWESVLSRGAAQAAAMLIAHRAIADAAGIAQKFPESARGFGKEAMGVRPSIGKKLVEETFHANDDARKAAETANIDKAKDHVDNVLDALRETKEKEDAYNYELNQKKLEIAQKRLEEIKKAHEKNEEIRSKAQEEHQKALDKVRADNAAKKEAVDTHNASKQRMYERVAKRQNEERAATEHQLELRRQKEEELKQETDNYYRKEDEAKVAAKDKENAAWKPWRDAMRGAEIDGSEIENKLKPITDVSPEAARAIRQLVPDSDDIEPTSDYGKERVRVMKSLGYGDNQNDYYKLTPDKKVVVDRVVESSGFEPEPLDFDPKAGARIPVDKVHRAQAIIGRNIRQGKYGFDGILRSEMMKVQNALKSAVSKATEEHGASELLDNARKETVEYQKAFGLDRHVPKDKGQARMAEANPEQFREQNDEERLASAEKRFPHLAESYRKVKALRDEVKKLPTEDQMRKKLKQPIKPPSVDHEMEKFRLKPTPEAVPEPEYVAPDEEPVPEPHTSEELHSLAFEKVKQPTREELPERPKEKVSPSEYAEAERVVEEFKGKDEKSLPESDRKRLEDARKVLTHTAPYEQKSIGLAELKERYGEEYAKNIESMRRRGIWYGIFLPWVRVAYELSTAKVSSAAMNAVGAAMTSVGTVFAVDKLANYLERENVRNWFINPSDEDMRKIYNNLSPKYQQQLAGDFQNVLLVAKKQGWKPSPKIGAFIAAHSRRNAPQSQSLESDTDLLKEFNAEGIQ